MPSLKPLVRAIYAATKPLGESDGAVVFGAPNEAHRSKCVQHQADVEAAIAKVVGAAVKVAVVVHESAAHDDNVVPLRRSPAAPADDDVDLSDLVDVPPASVQSPTDRLLDAFPGSQMIDE